MRDGVWAAVVALVLLAAVSLFFSTRHGGPPSAADDRLADVRSVDSSLPDSPQETEAREKLAYVSLAPRLPRGEPITPTRSLDSASRKRWDDLDKNLSAEQAQRAELLQALHERTRRFFVESAGAGSGRALISPEAVLMDDFWVYQEPNQPGERADFPVSPGEPLSRVEPDDELHSSHRNGMLLFLFPTGFGHVKDREHVAGFKAHGFRSPSGGGESDRWRVRHVQLIGILTRAEPVVYLTDKLPSMEQIRQGKTRPLDFFEEKAFPSLREGEDLYIARKGDTLRMLGAVRATRTCQQCHDAKVGDLLGAFSYTLQVARGVKKGRQP